MCGICGFSGNRNPDILKKMTDTIVHRGPDEAGFFDDDNINLGMRRLSIIDVDSGQQPIHNEDKSLWLVANGEIYNYIEIREDLLKKGHDFHTHHSDIETIVHLYEEYGLDFPNKMNGMFAFALWDKNQQKLILGRDRMGVKPLFYSLQDSEIIFGSEIKSILQHPSYKKEINYEAVYHYFTLKNIPAPQTAFKDIYSLKPGEMIIVENGQLENKKWWNINYTEDHSLDEGYMTEKIYSILEDAVKLRMRSDVPYGAYLSGGVDSSAIVALMSKISDKPIKTFSLGYKDQFENKEADMHFARVVHKMYNTEHYEYLMDYNELIDDAIDVIKAFDQPFSGVTSTFFLSKLISKHVKVALSGDGADELFGSYLSHRLAQPLSRFDKLYSDYQSGKLSKKDKQSLNNDDIEFLKRLYDLSDGQEVNWRYLIYLFKDDEKKILLNNNFLQNCKDASSLNLIKKYFSNLSAKEPLNRMLEMELKTQFPDQVLAFVDCLSMAHSVEVRSPFIDYRLVEFAATIPQKYKINNGSVKDILKKAVAPLLSDGIINRPKEGFVLPIYNWMADRFKNYSYEVLSKENLEKHSLLNYNEVSKILNDHYSNNVKNPAKIWTMINFQIWWEEYFG